MCKGPKKLFGKQVPFFLHSDRPALLAFQLHVAMRVPAGCLQQEAGRVPCPGWCCCHSVRHLGHLGHSLGHLGACGSTWQTLTGSLSGGFCSIGEAAQCGQCCFRADGDTYLVSRLKQLSLSHEGSVESSSLENRMETFNGPGPTRLLFSATLKGHEGRLQCLPCR